MKAIVRQPYGCPDTADYASPGEYSRAAREWEHAQAVCGCLRPVKPLSLDDHLPNDLHEPAVERGDNQAACKMAEAGEMKTRDGGGPPNTDS